MNEKVFIICIELNSNNFKNKFENIIKKIGNFINIIEGVYAIRVPYSRTSEEIRKHITEQLQGQYSIFVMKSNVDAAWRLLSNSGTWLNSYI